jgi:hypothetical protein
MEILVDPNATEASARPCAGPYGAHGGTSRSPYKRKSMELILPEKKR